MLKCLSDWKYFKIKAWIVFIDYKFEKWTFTEYMFISTDISIAISFLKLILWMQCTSLGQKLDS